MLSCKIKTKYNYATFMTSFIHFSNPLQLPNLLLHTQKLFWQCNKIVTSTSSVDSPSLRFFLSFFFCFVFLFSFGEWVVFFFPSSLLCCSKNIVCPRIIKKKTAASRKRSWRFLPQERWLHIPQLAELPKDTFI